MKKLGILSALTAAIALSASGANAEGMEECKVVGEDGKGLIKAHKGDCKTPGTSCAGGNPPDDPNAWILVPQGQCEKINKGDFEGVSDEIKDKIVGADQTEE